MSKSYVKTVLLVFSSALILATVGFIIWAKTIYRAESNKLAFALDETKSGVKIAEKANYWEISPRDATAETALIFYPGAKVEPQAYFYKLLSLANGQAGKLKIFVTKPTLNLAIFSVNQADEIIAEHAEIKSWIIGGHSLGGAMSCEYAKNNAAKISRILLFAAYCNSDVSQTNLKAVVIRGSLDGLLNPQTFAEKRQNLPADALNFEIEGMNHAQFGNYGLQSGDNAASKTDDEIRNELTEIFRKIVSR